ncbi:MAG: EamA family transporter [Desulfovibrionales bacterium]|nr:MAG: EamA family transporter [Desulfovibrionales bacterium]
MLPEAGLALAGSVLLHVIWNLMVRTQPQEACALWWILLAHILLLGPLGVSALLSEVAWTSAFVALLATSATANMVYFLGLRRAYEHAPVALVYPVVRSSPLFIAVWSSLFLGEAFGVLTWTGIVTSVLGLLVMATSARNCRDSAALPWMLLAMFATSIYSLSDKAATASITSFAGLLGFITFGYTAAWVGISLDLYRKTGRVIPRQCISPVTLLFGGLSVGTAYVLVIHAMRFMPSAEAVAYTNAGIVLASLVSIFILRERQHWVLRLLGAMVICLGLLVMRW